MRQYVTLDKRSKKAQKEYLDRFEEKKYMPELLFEDAEIVERVKNHPMALWKCKE